MASKSFAMGVIPAGLLIALCAGGSAIAQTSAQPKEVESIVVVAPRITYREVRPKDGSVIPKEVTITKKTALVSYGDLDLSRTADLYALEDRIDKAAAQYAGNWRRKSQRASRTSPSAPIGQPATPWRTCDRRHDNGWQRSRKRSHAGARGRGAIRRSGCFDDGYSALRSACFAPCV